MTTDRAGTPELRRAFTRHLLAERGPDGTREHRCNELCADDLAALSAAGPADGLRRCGCNCRCHAEEGQPDWPGSCAACCEPGDNCDCGRALSAPPPLDVAALTWQSVRKAITDAYYDTRNEGGTMETAADLAATRVMNLASQALSAAGPADGLHLTALRVVRAYQRDEGLVEAMQALMDVVDEVPIEHGPANGLREAAEKTADWLARVQIMYHGLVQKFSRDDEDTCTAGMCGDYREHRDLLRAALHHAPPPLDVAVLAEALVELLFAVEEVDNAWSDEGDHIEWDSDSLPERLIRLRKALSAYEVDARLPADTEGK